jgi:hypothetical protein
MAYSTTIYDPRQGMETILTSISKFDKDSVKNKKKNRKFMEHELSG